MHVHTSTNPITPPDLTGRIRDLVEACRPPAKANDKAIVAIKLCISEGIDTRNHIIASLTRAGFKGGHAAAILDSCCGPFAESYHWRLGADGRYSLHEDDDAGA